MGTKDGVVAEMPLDVIRPRDAAADVGCCGRGGARLADDGTNDATLAAKPPLLDRAAAVPALEGTNGVEVDASCDAGAAGGGMLTRSPGWAPVAAAADHGWPMPMPGTLNPGPATPTPGMAGCGGACAAESWLNGHVVSANLQNP